MSFYDNVHYHNINILGSQMEKAWEEASQLSELLKENPYEPD
jgi:hypothetical protein